MSVVEVVTPMSDEDLKLWASIIEIQNEVGKLQEQCSEFESCGSMGSARVVGERRNQASAMREAFLATAPDHVVEAFNRICPDKWRTVANQTYD